MLAWAQSMTWKGLKPIINLSKKVYQKGISLTKKEMKEIEKRLLRNPNLPQWDILMFTKLVSRCFQFFYLINSVEIRLRSNQKFSCYPPPKKKCVN